MPVRHRKFSVSRNQGLGTVELAATAIVLAVMVILAVDICMLMLGNEVLDRAARDAARAAAGQATLDKAVSAAQAALIMHKTDGHFITQPKLTSIESPDFVYQDFGGTPLGQVIPAGLPNAGQTVMQAPTVTVTTTVDVLLPASLGVFGVQPDQGPLTGGKMKFVRQYTFPIVRDLLNQQFS